MCMDVGMYVGVYTQHTHTYTHVCMLYSYIQQTDGKEDYIVAEHKAFKLMCKKMNKELFCGTFM